MKRMIYFLLAACVHMQALSQELYVFTEPASNMPAHTITPRIYSATGQINGDIRQRYGAEMMFGFSKKLMMHAGTTLSNMHSAHMRWESVYLYGKYRFYSHDGVHRHFRMAVFTEAAYSRNDYENEEVSIPADRSGIQAGIIATGLMNKVALSATVSHTQTLDASRFENHVPGRIYQSLNYSFSSGFLLLPVTYRNYDQLNVNLYAELLGQRTLDRKTFYVDAAPALQFIFKSNTKLNVGYRFQLDGNQQRTMKKSLLISMEHTFFNAMK